MSSSKVLHFAITSLLVLGAAASPAAAQVWISPPTIPATIPDPTGGFTISYWMGGSQYGAALAEVRFYLSTTKNGSSGVGYLAYDTVSLWNIGGRYVPPPGTRTVNILGPNTSAGASAMLTSIRDACQPQSLYLLAQVDNGFVEYAPTVMGTVKLADFSFTAGALSSSVIQPGGTTNLSFSLSSRCAASTPSHVGIFLADTNLSPLAFIGTVAISAGAGTWSLPPTPITFSSSIPPGSYRILLVADVNGTVLESSESNNAGFFELTVAGGAAVAKAEPGELQLGAELREDIGDELADLSRDPPAGYVSALRAAATLRR